jgi:hypothetical protein
MGLIERAGLSFRTMDVKDCDSYRTETMLLAQTESVNRQERFEFVTEGTTKTLVFSVIMDFTWERVRRFGGTQQRRRRISVKDLLQHVDNIKKPVASFYKLFCMVTSWLRPEGHGFESR